MSGAAATKRLRVLRLRRWMLGSVLIFVALLAGLIGYARHRARKALLNLPHRLGIDIKSETDGFTYSQTVKGRTLFTIHAAKAIQHQNGKTVLHNVAVTLYGAPGTNRMDTIRGNEFEYDQANGVVRALGETLLDVAAPEATHATVANSAKRFTVRGNGFVFLQKLGIASTKEPIQFRYGASEGEATGADYDMDTGVLILHRDVHLRSTQNGHPERIDAASAQIDRNTRTATLQQATMQDAEDSMRAPDVIASLRPATDNQAGSLERVQASGGVTLTTSDGQHAQASTLHADFTTDNRFAQVTMQGDVHVEGEEMRATAQKAVAQFHQGHAEHLLLAGQAHVERGTVPTQKQILEASQVQAALIQTRGLGLGVSELHADGNAKLIMVEPLAHTNRTQRTELTAPSVVAFMASRIETQQIERLDATGGTRLVQDDGTGNLRTSTGDRLQAAFMSASPQVGQNTLRSVLQEGHVSIVESRPAVFTGRSVRPASQSRATADRAEFQASTDQLVLTGSPKTVTDGLQLAADRVVLYRTSGDADATGTVKGSLLRKPTHEAGVRAAEPTQFAAATAHLSRSNGTVVLKGDDAADARLWIGSGQLEARVIEADQQANMLHAFAGSESSAADQVRTLLVQSPVEMKQQERTASAHSASSISHIPVVTHVFSRDVVYRGADTDGVSASVKFQGGVRLVQGVDVIRADSATAILQPGAQLTGAVQSIAADGHVQVIQPNRVATGSHLTYTVADRRAVLTGLPGAPPIVQDPIQGTIIGKELVLSLGQTRQESRVEANGSTDAPVHMDLEVPERSASTSTQPRSRLGRKPRPTP